MNKPKTFRHNLRQVTYAMIPFLFLGWVSIQFALENNPDKFSKFGAIIVLWSLVNMTITRTRYASYLSSWEQANSWRHIDFFEKENTLKDESLTTTFNLHACQIAQLSSYLGKSNPFVESDANSIQQFCQKVQAELSEEAENDFKNRQKQNFESLKSFKEEYSEEVEKIKSWEALIWRVELLLVCWGTLQNAYGADLISLLHR